MDSVIRIHPSKGEITSSEGNEIKGKRIVLCITGSVAAYRAIDLARLLMRHGADIYPVMSETVASMFLTADMMKWATGNNVVTKLTGDLEHIMLADDDMTNLILVYPCTANTIGKIANGIDDTPVTSILSVALGSKIPIIIAPAMHKSMYDNKFVMENIQRLKDQWIEFLEPSITEQKAKIIAPEQVLKFILNKFNSNNTLRGKPSIAGKNILITAGSTVEYIDPVRVITNLSSGKMGNAIAEEAKRLNANVTLVYGHGSYLPQNSSRYMNIIRVKTGKEMYNAVTLELTSKRRYDIVILASAVADFRLEGKKFTKKIDSKKKGKLTLSLSPTKKIIDQVKHISHMKRGNNNIFLVAFKAEHNVSNSYLIEKAFQKLKECRADLVVANDVGREGSEIGSDNDEVFIIDKRKRVIHFKLQNKRTIAKQLLDIIGQYIAVEK